MSSSQFQIKGTEKIPKKAPKSTDIRGFFAIGLARHIKSKRQLRAGRQGFASEETHPKPAGHWLHQPDWFLPVSWIN